MPLIRPDASLILPGATVRSIGVAGQVDAAAAPGDASRGDLRAIDEELADYGVPEPGARLLGSAITDQGLRAVLSVPLDELVTASGGGTDRGPGETPALELTVDGPAEGEGQVMLEVDAAGVVAWHLAEPNRDFGRDRALQTQVFRIPVQQLMVPGEDPVGETDRGLAGIGTKKLLQLLRYPIEQAAEASGRWLVGLWESRYRPYRLRTLDDPDRVLTSVDLSAFDAQPTLLLVHGTFSTCASAFDGVLRDTDFLRQMRTRYGPRILTFDHPSLHVDPGANARWLLEQFPPAVELVFDIISHSRGGLVARSLASQPFAHEVARQPATLRTTIHVATPNAGTVLADTQRWSTLLDTVTNLAMLFPSDTVSAPLTAVIETIKQVGTGVVQGLAGLSAMAPQSEWLTELATTPSTGKAYAVASDFDPVAASRPVRALNALIDPLFGEGNDLVVPTAGVSHAAGVQVADVLVLPQTPAITHVTYFRDQDVRTRIADWLQA